MHLEVERRGERTVLRAAGSTLARGLALAFLGAAPLFAAGAAVFAGDALHLVDVDHTRVACDREGRVCVVAGWVGSTSIPLDRLEGARAELQGDRTRLTLVCPSCDGGRHPVTGWNQRPALAQAWRERAETLNAFFADPTQPRVSVLVPRSELPPALVAVTLAAAAFFVLVIGRNARLGARSVTLTLDGPRGVLELRERGVLFTRRRVFPLREVGTLEVRSYLRELPSRGRMLELPFVELVLRARGRRFSIVDRAATKDHSAALRDVEAAWRAAAPLLRDEFSSGG